MAHILRATQLSAPHKKNPSPKTYQMDGYNHPINIFINQRSKTTVCMSKCNVPICVDGTWLRHLRK